MRNIGILAYWILLAVIGFYAWMQPFYNWDMLGYIASALSYEEKDIQKLHAITYDTVKNSIPPVKYDQLTSPVVSYNGHMAHNPQDFYDQLYIYKVKPLYVILVYLLYKLGVPIVNATILISIGAVMGIGALLARWLFRRWDHKIVGFLALLVVIILRLPTFARLSTPDTLAAFIVVLAVYVLIEHKRVTLSVVLFIISVSARVNNIILVLLMIFYLSWLAPQPYALKKKTGGMLSLLAISLYYFISQSAQFQSWWLLLNNSFLGFHQNFSTFNTPFSFETYFSLVSLGIARLFWDHQVIATTPFYVFWGMLLMILPRNNPSTKIYVHLIMLSFVLIFVQYVLYPVFDDRYFLAYHVILVMMSVLILIERSAVKNQS